jgi:D-threo-aldose 1-dehydrogenase
MKYTEIRNTGIKIPSIIFGTSALGNLYMALDDITKLSIVKECLRSVDGPVVFDSAGKCGAGLTSKEPTFEKGVWMDIHYDADSC